MSLLNIKLNKISDSFSLWVLKVGSSKTKTEGDMRDKARSIMRPQGYGTHLAWIPVYLSRFKNSESANSVTELKTVLRKYDKGYFYGMHIALNSSCYYGNN